MKKLSILFAGLLVTAMVFTSCSKDEETTGTNNLGKAKVTGYVYLQSDVTSDATDRTSQFAPSGTQVILKINSDDLAQDGNNANAADKAYYTTIGSDGMYSFSVDAGAKNVNVLSLTAVDLELDYIRPEFSAGHLHDTTYTRHWSAGNFGGMVLVEKDIVYQNLTYAGQDL